MDLVTKITSFISRPCPVWEVDLTSALIRYKDTAVTAQNQVASTADYNTINSFFKDTLQYPVVKYPLNIGTSQQVFLEQPSLGYLHGFYTEHGLEPLSLGKVTVDVAINKLEAAFNTLFYIPACLETVSRLVRCIQLLKAENDETDVSYSHPEIPFSIFVSICQRDSLVSNLRVAESILHEAMHLKLTLIESSIPLLEMGSPATFFSPWRGEDRPVRGVLHGQFVFRAILDFYKQIVNIAELSEGQDFIDWRIEQISSELASLRGFPESAGLTKDGASLSANLLP